MLLETQAPGGEATPPRRSDRDVILGGLFRTYRVRLIRHFWRLHHPRDELEDLVADVFVRLCACDFTLLMERPGAMVFRVANFVSADAYRAKGRLKRAGQPDFDCDLSNDLADGAPDPEQRLAWRQDIKAALHVANALPPKGAKAFILFRFHEMTTREIAELQGVAVKTIENHIAASTSRFQSAFEAVA